MSALDHDPDQTVGKYRQRQPAAAVAKVTELVGQAAAGAVYKMAAAADSVGAAVVVAVGEEPNGYTPAAAVGMAAATNP